MKDIAYKIESRVGKSELPTGAGGLASNLPKRNTSALWRCCDIEVFPLSSHRFMRERASNVNRFVPDMSHGRSRLT